MSVIAGADATYSITGPAGGGATYTFTEVGAMYSATVCVH